MRTKFFRSIRQQVALLTVLTVVVILVMAAVFFMQAQRLTEKKNASFVHTLLEQLSSQLDQIGEEMIYLSNSACSNETLQQYLHATLPTRRLAYATSFTDFTSSLLEHSDTVSHIVLVNTNQSILSATERNVMALDRLDAAYQLFDRDHLRFGFYGPAFDTFTGTELFAYVQPVFNTHLGAAFREKMATCVTFARTSLLSDTLQSAHLTPNTVLLLVDDDRQIISSTNANASFLDALPDRLFQPAASDESDHDRIYLGGTSYLTDSQAVSTLGWRLICIVPESEIMVDLMPLLWLGMLICVIFSILTAAWSIHIHHYITEPLTRITAFIENDLDDKLQNRIHINTNSEMELFCQEINTLLDKVSEMTTANLRSQAHVYELSLAKKRAELSALQSQINPHFLYNTLDCLRGYGYMLHSNEVVSITNSLSAIMRYCIKGSDTVALKEELNIINLYLDIIRIRFPNRFTFVFDIDPGVLHVHIPRVILQPVVENAIYHGLEASTERGTLTIACHRNESGDCLLSVQDTGVGIPEETLNSLHARLADTSFRNILNIPAGNSLGLVNIHNRLRNHYGDRYGLDIQCPAEGGTRVTMLFPFVPQSSLNT